MTCSVELMAEVEVDDGGLEEDVLDGNDEWLVWVENVGRVFLRPILFVRQSGCDLELNLVIRTRIKLDRVVCALFWPFRGGNDFFIIIVQGFIKIWAFTPRLRRERQCR